MRKTLNRSQHNKIGKGSSMAGKLPMELNDGEKINKKYADKVQLGTAINDYRRPPKTYWQIYGLQILSPDKFAEVVNKITKREYILIK